MLFNFNPLQFLLLLRLDSLSFWVITWMLFLWIKRFLSSLLLIFPVRIFLMRNILFSLRKLRLVIILIFLFSLLVLLKTGTLYVFHSFLLVLNLLLFLHILVWVEHLVLMVFWLLTLLLIKLIIVLHDQIHLFSLLVLAVFLFVS